MSNGYNLIGAFSLSEVLFTGFGMAITWYVLHVVVASCINHFVLPLLMIQGTRENSWWKPWCLEEGLVDDELWGKDTKTACGVLKQSMCWIFGCRETTQASSEE